MKRLPYGAWSSEVCSNSIKLLKFHLLIIFWPILSRYKPPELLLGASEYSSAADMWSVGCIFAELLLRRPFLQGKNSDISQLDTIFTVFGTPNETNWPDHQSLPLCVRGLEWDETTAIPFDEIFTAAPKDAISLLRSIMVLDPNMRFSASQCLSHPYFQNDPTPTPKEKLVLSAWWLPYTQ